MADSTYRSRYVYVGAFCQERGSNVLKTTELGKNNLQRNFDAVKPTPISIHPSGTSVPNVFIGDESFDVSEILSRPYPANIWRTKKKNKSYYQEHGIM